MNQLTSRLGGFWLAGLVSVASAFGGGFTAWARAVSKRSLAGNGSRQFHKRPPLARFPAGGRSTPVIVNGRIYGENLTGKGITEQDEVFALDVGSGKEIWQL